MKNQFSISYVLCDSNEKWLEGVRCMVPKVGVLDGEIMAATWATEQAVELRLE